MTDKTRCDWCLGTELEKQYHDQEWGTPLHDEQRLFEFLILEGAQAGLSWRTVLEKREGYRRAFKGFDAAKIVKFSDKDVERLMQDSSIIRNRLKITSTISNAQAYLKMLDAGETLNEFFWGFVEGKPIQNHWTSLAKVPAQTLLSEQLSKTLKKKGFRFVGPTICYAFMQATGMVNDHLVSCYRHAEVAQQT